MGVVDVRFAYAWATPPICTGIPAHDEYPSITQSQASGGETLRPRKIGRLMNDESIPIQSHMLYDWRPPLPNQCYRSISHWDQARILCRR